jgi:hypothetical protein
MALHQRLIFWGRRSNRLETSWASTIDQAIEDLRTLNVATEADFLTVGGKLMEFRVAARQISSDMTALVEVVSAEGGQDRALASMLEDSTHRNARIEESGKALAEVRDLSRKILLAFSQLRDTVSTFRALCILTRIETSRLGAASLAFAHLADEVKPLSERIHASGEVIWEASAQLQESVEAALKRCSSLQAQQLEELPPLIAGVTGALGVLEEHRESAYRTSADQAAQYREMGEAIEQLVNSLQIHDSTRQQLEHVAQALEEIKPRFSNTGRTRAILSLQSRQLLSAGQAFSASIDRIGNELEAISTHTREIAEASRGLIVSSSDDSGSFLEQMEGCFQAILDGGAAFNRERLEMQCTAAGVELTIARMRSAAVEIRQIEIQIQRIAINAGLGAIHIGPSGQALSLIADVMQNLARDSNSNTEDVVAALDDMSGAISRVSGAAVDASSTGETDAPGAMEAMRAALSDLHRAGQTSFNSVHQITDAGVRLSELIATLRAGFSAGLLFAEVVDRVRSEIDGIAEECLPGRAHNDEAVHAQDLEMMVARYTMQRERDVHNMVINGVAPDSNSAEVSYASGGFENDLHGSLDLF